MITTSTKLINPFAMLNNLNLTIDSIFYTWFFFQLLSSATSLAGMFFKVSAKTPKYCGHATCTVAYFFLVISL